MKLGMKRTSRRIVAFALTLCMVIGLCPATAQIANAAEEKTPYEKYGDVKITTDATTGYRQLSDENGNPIQLKGMSTFGLQWADGDWVLNDSAFDALAKDWKCDIVRLAMYVTEEGYADHPAELLNKMEQGIKIATDRGMYVLIDWHVLSPGDPMSEKYLSAGESLVKTNTEFAKIKDKHLDYRGPQLFFAYLSEKYGDQGNVLFETANEPNGLGTEENAADTWKNKILPYHQSVLDAIRTYDKDDKANIILCGTDNWSQFVDAPVANPVQDKQNAGDEQVMYGFHFYAGTHDVKTQEDGTYWLGEKIKSALKGGLAVFCSEWGTSEATGDGGPYINYSQRWVDFLKDNKISWCAWSLGRKTEISAAMKKDTPIEPTDHNNDGIPDWKMDELSITGNYVRAMIRGEVAPMYTSEEMVFDFEDGNVGAIVPGDSPVNDYEIKVEKVRGNSMLKCAPIAQDNVWAGPRVSFQDVGTMYSVYKNMSFDVYLPQGCDTSSLSLNILPVLQTGGNSYWGPMDEVALSGSDFTLDEATGLMKKTVVVPVKDAVAKDKLGHITFLLAGSEGNEGFYMDNIKFVTSYNGDVADAPVVPDDPGKFVSLPFTFESGQREGWKKDGESKVDYTKISIEEVGKDNHAMAFPIAFEPGKNEWEDGARLTSPYGIYKFDDCVKYDAFAMNVYIEADKATKGKVSLVVCSTPNGEGYWYQSGEYTIDPTKGEPVTTPGGVKLLKYYVYIPLNATKYGAYPFSITAKTEIRNTILALHNQDSDYAGRVYYDNIRYVDAENLDNIDKEKNEAFHKAILNPKGDQPAVKPANPAQKKTVLKKNGIYKVGNAKYKVISNKTDGKGTVKFVGLTKKKITRYTIKSKVKIEGSYYKITEISARAFMNNKKLKKLIIGKEVRSIGKMAFYGCTKLKRIVIQTSYLTKKTVGDKAFKGIASRTNIIAPKKKVKAYRSILKKRGIGRKVRVMKR